MKDEDGGKVDVSRLSEVRRSKRKRRGGGAR